MIKKSASTSVDIQCLFPHPGAHKGLPLALRRNSPIQIDVKRTKTKTTAARANENNCCIEFLCAYASSATGPTGKYVPPPKTSPRVACSLTEISLLWPLGHENSMPHLGFCDRSKSRMSCLSASQLQALPHEEPPWNGETHRTQ